MSSIEFEKDQIEALLRLGAETLFENKRVSSLPLGQVATLVRDKYPALGSEKYDGMHSPKRLEHVQINFSRATNWLAVYYASLGLDASGRETLSNVSKKVSEQKPLKNPFQDV